jgi:tRNA threonylcarbamoyladenosine biosynthesis protein TsaE
MLTISQITPDRLVMNLPDVAAMAKLGTRLAASLSPGQVVHLQGDLGTGKTTLTRGVLRALGVHDHVRSPTYTLVEHYLIEARTQPQPSSRINFYHFDLYRFRSPEEWTEAGFAENLRSDSILWIEWPERAAPVLPTADLTISLLHCDVGRQAILTADQPAGQRMLSAVAAVGKPETTKRL